MGYTRQWYEERPQRVARMIDEARREHSLSIGMVSAVIDEFSGCDQPTLEDARQAARLLGQLQIRELRGLMREALRALASEAEGEVWRAERDIEERLPAVLERHEADGPGAIGVAEIQQPTDSPRGSVMWIALALQTLVWAVNLPPEHRPLFMV